MEYYAHKKENDKEKVIDHLTLCEEYGAIFGRQIKSEGLVRQACRIHDVGKVSNSFQNVLMGNDNKRDHAIAGAVAYYNLSELRESFLKKYLSLVVASHHSYLYSNYNDLFSILKKDKNLDFTFGPITTRDKNKTSVIESKEDYEIICNYIKENNLIMPLSENDYLNISEMTENEKMFYIRMITSCLVDADYTSTTVYQDDKDYYEKSTKNKLNPDELLKKLDDYQSNLTKNSTAASEMNIIRNEVYHKCAKAGKTINNSCCTLTAPPGAGKTLSLMRFALENAKEFCKKRIFVVLPFLSIINQNAQIYKDIFGDDIVFIDDSQTKYNEITKLYSDRWSAPIIVTTSVKLCKTLFSSKPTNLRKMHNLADSVIVFDEYQTLNPNVINTTIETFNTLAKYYNATVLFSTATNPFYNYRAKKIEGEPRLKNNFIKTNSSPLILSDMKWNCIEIINDVESLFTRYEKIKNTNIYFDTQKEYSCDDLINYYQNSNQVLYVFNTVKHATSMYSKLIEKYGKENCYLLTSNFCAADKLYIINQVNEKLKNGEKVYLASTQCIEAGVDFDFPVGAREYAPMDSVTQASGRVNRNGKYKGEFLVFKYIEHTQYDYPSQSYHYASDITFNLAKKYQTLNIYNSLIMEEYFKELYQSSNYSSDKKELLEAIQLLDFKMMDDNYNLIEAQNTVTIIVPPYFAKSEEKENAEQIINKIINNDYVITKELMKQVAPYTVQMYISKNNNPSDIATQLSFKKNDGAKTNWYIIKDSTAYSESGLISSRNNNSGK